MSQAAIFDLFSLKWPFAVRPFSTPPRTKSAAPRFAPTAPVRPDVADRVVGKEGGSVTTMVIASGAYAKTDLGRITPCVSAAALTGRQMVGDIVLVAAWGALIPVVLWLGHAAGF
jgi:hypothetical protein